MNQKKRTRRTNLHIKLKHEDIYKHYLYLNEQMEVDTRTKRSVKKYSYEAVILKLSKKFYLSESRIEDVIREQRGK